MYLATFRAETLNTVRGGSPRRMVVQEGRPALARSSRALDHVLGDSRLGDLDAKLEQLAVDPARAPQTVGAAHLPDQVADLSWNRWGGCLWNGASNARRPRTPAYASKSPSPV